MKKKSVLIAVLLCLVITGWTILGYFGYSAYYNYKIGHLSKRGDVLWFTDLMGKSDSCSREEIAWQLT